MESINESKVLQNLNGEKKYPEGAAKVKKSKAGNNYLSGYFKIDDKTYFISLVKKNQPDKRGWEYSVFVNLAPEKKLEVENQVGQELPF